MSDYQTLEFVYHCHINVAFLLLFCPSSTYVMRRAYAVKRSLELLKWSRCDTHILSVRISSWKLVLVNFIGNTAVESEESQTFRKLCGSSRNENVNVPQLHAMRNT